MTTMFVDEVRGQRDNRVIRASAGTGKTYHLSNRFLDLVFDGIPLDQILATTFTRQAAREILNRILFRVATAAESDRERRNLGVALERSDITRDLCLDKLKLLTASLHRIHVSTLDAFFIQMAGAFSLEVGLPLGWRILEDAEETRLRDAAIGQMLERDKVTDSVELMHLLTKGEARRGVAQLIRETVAGLHDLFADSDAAAWKRLKWSPGYDDAFVRNALRVLEELEGDNESLLEAKRKDHERASQAQWSEFLEKGIAAKVAAGETTYSRKPIPGEWLEVYAILVQHAGSEIRNRVAVQTESTYKLLSRFNEFFQRAKHDARCFRFDDIVRRLRGSQEPQDVDRFTFRMDSQVEHLLLDEFQDTSLNQWRVIRPFAQRIAAEPALRSFFCVGDVKQAIYGWRGGDADILDLLDEQIDGVRKTELSSSFRSSPVIIDFVNELNLGLVNSSKLSDEQTRAVKRWCDQYPLHTTARMELPGFVAIETTSAEVDADDEDVAEEHTDNPALRDIAERVSQLVRQLPSSKIAVLTRTNLTVAKLIFHLRLRSVSASEVGGNPLTDSTAVQLILSRLKLADHPGDQCAAYHLATSPWAIELGLTPESDERQACDVSANTRKLLSDVGYGQAVQIWAHQLRSFCDAREWRRLTQLVELAHRHQQKIERPVTVGFSSQQRVTLRTAEFIQTIETERVADPSESQVRVMTVHQSKGLQFDAVVLAELDKKLRGQTPRCVSQRPTPFDQVDCVTTYISVKQRRFFPADIQAMHGAYERDDLREELCVLYVAATRAIHALYIMLEPCAKPRATTAGLIQAAIGIPLPLEPNSRVYQSGNERWYDSAAKTHVPSPVEPIEPHSTPRSIRLRAASGLNRRATESISPSSREGGTLVRLADRLNIEGSEALRYGTLIHAWFEQVKWLDFAPASDESLRRVGRHEGMHDEQIDRALSSFRKMLSRSAIRQLLTEAEYLESNRFAQFQFAQPVRIDVLNEQPINGRTAEGFVNGIVDRLLVFRDATNQPIAADIIDYKTDTIDSDDPRSLELKVEFYRPQLSIYRATIQQMLRLQPDRVHACLAFVGHGAVCAVE